MNSALQSRRLWILGGAVVAVLAVVAAYFLAISPTMSSASNLRSQVADTENQNTVLSVKNASLARQQQHIDVLKAKVLKAIDSLPPKTSLPQFTVELTQLAKATGVHLSSVNVGGVTPVTAAGGTTTTQTPDPASTSSSPAPAASTPVAATAPAAGQFSISVTTTTSGSYAQQLAFLSAVRTGARRALIMSTQTSVQTSGSTNLVAQMTIFTAPLSDAQLSQLKQALAHG